MPLESAFFSSLLIGCSRVKQGKRISGSTSSLRMIFPLLWFFSACIGFAWSTITALTVGASEAPSKRWRKLTDIYKIPEPRNGRALMPMDPAARAKWSVVLRPSWKDSYQKLWILDSLRFTYASERFLSGPLQMQACTSTFCSMTPQTWLLETPSLRNWNRKQQAGTWPEYWSCSNSCWTGIFESSFTRKYILWWRELCRMLGDQQRSRICCELRQRLMMMLEKTTWLGPPKHRQLYFRTLEGRQIPSFVPVLCRGRSLVNCLVGAAQHRYALPVSLLHNNLRMVSQSHFACYQVALVQTLITEAASYGPAGRPYCSATQLLEAMRANLSQGAILMEVASEGAVSSSQHRLDKPVVSLPPAKDCCVSCACLTRGTFCRELVDLDRRVVASAGDRLIMSAGKVEIRVAPDAAITTAGQTETTHIRLKHRPQSLSLCLWVFCVDSGLSRGLRFHNLQSFPPPSSATLTQGLYLQSCLEGKPVGWQEMPSECFRSSSRSHHSSVGRR